MYKKRTLEIAEIIANTSLLLFIFIISLCYLEKAEEYINISSNKEILVVMGIALIFVVSKVYVIQTRFLIQIEEEIRLLIEKHEENYTYCTFTSAFEQHTFINLASDVIKNPKQCRFLVKRAWKYGLGTYKILINERHINVFECLVRIDEFGILKLIEI